MVFTYSTSDDALLQEIGARIANVRLARNLTQADLAEQAGIGVRTVQRLEQGASATHLSGFFRVCRALGLLDRLDSLIPVESVSPMAQLTLKQRQRRRASSVRESPSAAKTPWSWGE